MKEIVSDDTVHFKFDGDGEERTTVLFANGDSESLLVTQVGPDLFRLEESSLLGEAMYRDVVSANLQSDGSLKFREVVTPSGLATQTWILWESLIESDDFCRILDDVMTAGGNWERAFGGLLLVHAPPDRADEFFKRIQLASGGTGG